MNINKKKSTRFGLALAVIFAVSQVGTAQGMLSGILPSWEQQKSLAYDKLKEASLESLSENLGNEAGQQVFRKAGLPTQYAPTLDRTAMIILTNIALKMLPGERDNPWKKAAGNLAEHALTNKLILKKNNVAKSTLTIAATIAGTAALEAVLPQSVASLAATAATQKLILGASNKEIIRRTTASAASMGMNKFIQDALPGERNAWWKSALCWMTPAVSFFATNRFYDWWYGTPQQSNQPGQQSVQGQVTPGMSDGKNLTKK